MGGFSVAFQRLLELVVKALIYFFFKPLSDFTVNTAGSEGMLFNIKPLQNTSYGLQLPLAIVPLKTVLAFTLCEEGLER